MAVRSRTLKHESGDIGDHLRNHVHLTNCIHLKNHMHKHSPILAERSLMRDLIVLQRSRSLRDPSTSPPSWHSPSIVDSLSKKLAKDAALQEGRGSVRIERRKEGRTLSGSSLPVTSVPTSKVSPGEVSRWSGGGEITGDRSGLVRIRNGKGIQGEELSQKYYRTDLSHSTEDPVQCDRNWVSDLIPGKSEPKDKRISQKGKYRQDSQLKTLSQQLSELPVESEDVASSHIHRRSKNTQEEKMRKRKFRGVRRSRASVPSRDIGAHNELSVASNSLAQGPRHPKFHVVEGEGEDTEQNVTRAPRNGCGIPWNWSRIHHRGRTFLDMAGRSLSCGLSDSRLRKGGTVPQGRGVSDIPLASDHSSSSTKSNAEALPLLIEPYGSQESSENAAWLHDYSGELGIFADNGLKHELDSDLASEARSGDQHKFRGHHHGGHRSLTEKYMPRTFRDLVGQNLVAQALSNAVIKRKIGLVYVFYGPHGTGKTSCARIFSRALNCQSSEYSKPCNFCNSCIAHDMGKRQNVREIGPVSNFDFESIMDLLDNMTVSQLQSQYRVFIFDDCDTLSPDCWSAILKVIDRAPRRVVFVLISTSLDHLPHIILSRCQKFFFPKLKDADIIYTLQWIATKEDLEIDKDALKLIASRSDGSLRDAEMTLEQLSLLGQRISVPLVQELVGLISDDKLVDLLDLALSADTVNTVKNLREIMEAGVEPLPLMSQLATVITDILAGCYEFTKERRRRKFFRHQALSKEDMEKLRQALKTLSEAEKQLRMSNDKITWLTAALLQLAPDRQYMLPSSSENSSFSHSPLGLNNMNGRGIVRKSTSEPVDASNNGRGFSTKNRAGSLRDASTADIIYDNGKMAANSMGGRRNAGMTPQRSSALSTGITRAIDGQISGKGLTDIEEIWLAVLEKIQIDSIKQFMQQEGKLVSVSFGAAPTVQLMFGSHLTKSKIEKFRCHILQAFESVLGSPVTIEIRCEPKKDAREGIYGPIILSASEGESQLMKNPVSVTNNGLLKAGYDNNIKRVTKNKDTKGAGSSHSKQLQSDTLEAANSEIVEILASPRDSKCIENGDGILKLDQRGLESACDGEASSSHQQSTFGSHLERRNIREHQSQSLVRSKVSLAHVIQQAEGCAQRSGWSKRKAISIAEKLEQENLRLEPRSRSLLCWKASKVTRGKLSRLKIRTRRPRSFLKLVPCARCISDKSPR